MQEGSKRVLGDVVRAIARDAPEHERKSLLKLWEQTDGTSHRQKAMRLERTRVREALGV